MKPIPHYQKILDRQPSIYLSLSTHAKILEEGPSTRGLHSSFCTCHISMKVNDDPLVIGSTHQPPSQQHSVLCSDLHFLIL